MSRNAIIGLSSLSRVPGFEFEIPYPKNARMPVCLSFDQLQLIHWTIFIKLKPTQVQYRILLSW